MGGLTVMLSNEYLSILNGTSDSLVVHCCGFYIGGKWFVGLLNMNTSAFLSLSLSLSLSVTKLFKESSPINYKPRFCYRTAHFSRKLLAQIF